MSHVYQIIFVFISFEPIGVSGLVGDSTGSHFTDRFLTRFAWKSVGDLRACLSYPFTINC